MNLAIIPHQDDENLFISFTLQREKPLVLIVTDSYIQFNRGDGITAEQRRNESIEASKLIGYPVLFACLRDDSVTSSDVVELLSNFNGFGKVYAPAIQGGNIHHDMIGEAAKQVFPGLIQYTTYTKTELWTKGNTEIVPTKEENELKIKALGCYTSQLNLLSTRPHFAAVLDKSEFYV